LQVTALRSEAKDRERALYNGVLNPGHEIKLGIIEIEV
jgi:hypothetical protein